MIPVYQTLTVANDGFGNCFNACVASLLERPLRDVAQIHPNFDGRYWTAWHNWLEHQGLKRVAHAAAAPPKGWSIAHGDGFRTYPEGHDYAGVPIGHAVVAFDGEVLHDPFPGGQGLKTIDGYWTLEALEYG